MKNSSSNKDNNSGPPTHSFTLSLTNPPINRMIDGSIIVETVTRNPCSSTDRLKDISLSGVLSLKMLCVSATSRYFGKHDPQEQSEIVNKYMAQKIDEMILKGTFDRSSCEGLDLNVNVRDLAGKFSLMETAGAFHYFSAGRII